MPTLSTIPGLAVPAFVRGLNNNRQISSQLVVSLSSPTDPAAESPRLEGVFREAAKEFESLLGLQWRMNDSTTDPLAEETVQPGAIAAVLAGGARRAKARRRHRVRLKHRVRFHRNIDLMGSSLTEAMRLQRRAVLLVLLLHVA